VQAIFNAVPAWLIIAAVVAGLCVVCLAQTDDEGDTDEDGTEEPSKEVSFFQLLLKGRWFMIPIGLCSFIGLTIIIERLVALRTGRIIPGGFLPGLRSVFRHARADRAAGLNYCQTHDCPIARVVSDGIGKFHKGEETVEQAMEDAGAREVHKLRRNLRMLQGVAAVAPMLGLLGTVWGLIKAFERAYREGLGKPQVLAEGIYIALVTTLAGLMVAIPALIFYYYFLGKIEQIVSRMNDVSIEFFEHYVAEGTAERTPERAPAAAAR
jgi:biopolymer transport protein ExbB